VKAEQPASVQLRLDRFPKADVAGRCCNGWRHGRPADAPVALIKVVPGIELAAELPPGQLHQPRGAGAVAGPCAQRPKPAGSGAPESACKRPRNARPPLDLTVNLKPFNVNPCPPPASHKPPKPARPKPSERLCFGLGCWRGFRQCSTGSARATQPSYWPRAGSYASCHGGVAKAAPGAAIRIPMARQRWVWRLGAAQRRYNERLTPGCRLAHAPFDNGKTRISRRLQIGKVVNYETVSPAQPGDAAERSAENLSGSPSGAGL